MSWVPTLIDSVLHTCHPEQKAGEIFLGNYSLEEFQNLEHHNKRHGQVAYGEGGKIIMDKVPVFVSETEHKSREREVTVEIGR